MEVYENLLKIYENLRKSMKTYENLRKLMKIYGFVGLMWAHKQLKHIFTTFF